VIRSVRIAKRLLDISASFIGLALTLPLYPLMAAAIYIDSPGPVLFRQRRAGMLIETGDGEHVSPRRLPQFVEFDMLKLRTMRPDAERQTGAVWAENGDPRVTRVGRFLRRTRLDEVPQLWNVLRGDMSLVGPRPERPEILANLAMAIPFFEERMRRVKPGITGMAQVSLGYTGAVPKGSPVEPHVESLTNPFKIADSVGAVADEMRMKVLYDYAYSASLEKFGTFLRTELGVLVKTPLVMLRGIGR
jgi:lipopolysaccharide/colanic/teichoic acid biosynthesis glycosyltransferase